jgi:cyclic pyranopterin phosphate synthase
MGSPVLQPNRVNRLHVNLGFVCNNNCWFCMEDDRDRRLRTLRAQTDDEIRAMLQVHRGGEVHFTSGEPTLHPHLPTYIAWAKALRYSTIGLISNGRRFGYEPYARLLLEHGLNHAVISIHGHEARLHEVLTRTPGSFAQTREGILTLARLRAEFPLKLHTSTVLNRRNAPHLAAIYSFLKSLGVEQVVYNTIQAVGRGERFFDELFPRYSDLSRIFGEFLAARGHAVTDAFLLDVPYCVTEALPAFNRGFVERRVHYERRDAAPPHAPDHADLADAPGGGLAENYRSVDRSDLDGMYKSKREACRTCARNQVCDGVFKPYLEHYGWDEFIPVKEA